MADGVGQEVSRCSSVQRPSVCRCMLIRHRLRRSGLSMASRDRWRSPPCVGPRGVGVTVLEQVVFGFTERLVDDHPGAWSLVEMEMEPAVVTEPESTPPDVGHSRSAAVVGGRPGPVGRAARSTRSADPSTSRSSSIGAASAASLSSGSVSVLSGSVTPGEVVLAQQPLQLPHGEHRGEFGHVVVGPRWDLPGHRSHLVE